jgi:membrane-associated phospholipid phosphatase
MFTINTLAIATTLAFNWFTKNAVARARPYMRHCREDPQSDFGCNDVDRNRSFYSGHTAFAVTGAGLICMHHSRLPLYGDPGDSVACGVAIGVASAIALFRIFADKHYLSDVLVGAAAGVISGVLMPWFLRYGFNDSPFR